MDMFLIQHKQSGKRYHRVDLEELKQLRSDALQQNKYPVYMIEFDNDDTGGHYLISAIAFYELKDYLEGLPE